MSEDWILIYEMLSGRVPFTGETLDLRDEIIHNPPKKLDTKLWDIISRCLEKDLNKAKTDLLENGDRKRFNNFNSILDKLQEKIKEFNPNEEKNDEEDLEQANKHYGAGIWELKSENPNYEEVISSFKKASSLGSVDVDIKLGYIFIRLITDVFCMYSMKNHRIHTFYLYTN